MKLFFYTIEIDPEEALNQNLNFKNKFETNKKSNW